MTLPVGASEDAARARAGSPTERIPLQSGGQVWFYDNPLGFSTYRLEFDPAGKLVSRQQVLSGAHFDQVLIPGHSTTDQVHLALGRPLSMEHYPNMNEEAWTYRWMDVTLEMLTDLHFDTKTGRLKTFNSYRDPAYVSSNGGNS